MARELERTMTGREDYFLGLPAWAFPGWKDSYFRDTPTRLASYARVFNTVEGNTTFYRVPDAETVARWRDAVAKREFRFCFKLPSLVTHAHRPDLAELEHFLTAIAPLKDSIGPLLLQFPSSVGPEQLPHFEGILERVREKHTFVIEVRHRAFFREPELLEPVLERFAAGRVVLDSRPIYEGDRSHPEVLDALHEKPDVPVVPTTYNDLAFVRLILHPDLVSNARYIQEWARHVAGYLRRGITTYMMIHCPNNLHCPPLAADFHRELGANLEGLGDLPSWPMPEQLSLV